MQKYLKNTYYLYRVKCHWYWAETKLLSLHCVNFLNLVIHVDNKVFESYTSRHNSNEYDVTNNFNNFLMEGLYRFHCNS